MAQTYIISPNATFEAHARGARAREVHFVNYSDIAATIPSQKLEEASRTIPGDIGSTGIFGGFVLTLVSKIATPRSSRGGIEVVHTWTNFDTFPAQYASSLTTERTNLAWNPDSMDFTKPIITTENMDNEEGAEIDRMVPNLIVQVRSKYLRTGKFAIKPLDLITQYRGRVNANSWPTANPPGSSFEGAPRTWLITRATLNEYSFSQANPYFVTWEFAWRERTWDVSVIRRDEKGLPIAGFMVGDSLRVYENYEPINFGGDLPDIE